MNELLKTLLSLSVSGSVLILILLLGSRLYQNWLSRRWQYLIWLVVIARLLLPFGREGSPVDQLFRQQQEILVEHQAGRRPVTDWQAPPSEPAAGQEPEETAAGFLSLARQYLWLLWLLVALALLVSRIAGYRSFLRYLRAGRRQVSDIALLDALALEGQQLGVNRPVELYTHGLISSPLLVGVLRPCILLPEGQRSLSDFRHIVRHELVHYRHRDALVKWLAQLALCVHWFNPLVWQMCRRLDQVCELACDEGATRQLDQGGRRDYGDALMRALSADRQMPTPPAAIALHRSAELLQQRFHALMNNRKPSKELRLLSFSLALVLMTGTAAAGAYTGPAQAAERPAFSLQQLLGRLLGRITVMESSSRSGNSRCPKARAAWDWALRRKNFIRPTACRCFSWRLPSWMKMTKRPGWTGSTGRTALGIGVSQSTCWGRTAPCCGTVRKKPMWMGTPPVSPSWSPVWGRMSWSSGWTGR